MHQVRDAGPRTPVEDPSETILGHIRSIRLFSLRIMLPHTKVSYRTLKISLFADSDCEQLERLRL